MNRRSIWSNLLTSDECKELKENISTDVAIIGAGIAGILTAKSLTENGIHCVILEAK